MKNSFFKIVLLLFLGSSLLFSSVDFNTASKEDLMGIKGIGEKKALTIIEYRKTNSINSVDDLKNIKGFGDKLITKIKEEIK